MNGEFLILDNSLKSAITEDRSSDALRDLYIFRVFNSTYQKLLPKYNDMISNSAFRSNHFR